MKVKVAQSRLCNPMDYTVRGILHTRILEWASFPFSRESSQLRDRTCHGTFNFKGSYMLFSSFVCHSLKTLFLINSWKTGMSRAAHSSQDWDHEKGHLLGFLSVTPFSDLLLKGNLFSYVPLTQDMKCFLALWRLLFAWLILLNLFTALYEGI